ncbi:MAG: hypothetical protein LQ340_006072 [Diploschistes diacapsis]|nr:MAG: hypothetical protein LQ340_006072 [Diploschistes diacapsis]
MAYQKSMSRPSMRDDVGTKDWTGAQKDSGSTPRSAMLNLIVLGLLVSSVKGQDSVSPVPGASRSIFSEGVQYNGYGYHQPHGVAAVSYIYGDQGTWRQYTGLENIYGYYNVPQSEMDQLVAYANGNNPATCADPNGNVLFNLPYESSTASGTSFEEHNGQGAGGATIGQPFSQFWFDDNWLARYMSQAYGAPQPSGLFDAATRWQILVLDPNGWPQQGGSAPDQDALTGLYYIATGNSGAALNMWNGMLGQSGAGYDSNNQQYGYSSLSQEYYLGLFRILTDMLIDAGIDGSDQANLIQHSISLRSAIMSEQQVSNGNRIGWLTGRTDASTIINTETTSIAVLGLCANAKICYEAGQSPMDTPSGYFYRPYNVLSAVVGLSPVGYMAFGPYANIPTGSYTVDFFLRTPTPGSLTATLDVHDANDDQVLGSNIVSGGQFAGGNQWGRYSVVFSVSNPSNSMEFRVYWGGQENLDVSAIRIR